MAKVKFRGDTSTFITRLPATSKTPILAWVALSFSIPAGGPLTFPTLPRKARPVLLPRWRHIPISGFPLLFPRIQPPPRSGTLLHSLAVALTCNLSLLLPRPAALVRAQHFPQPLDDLVGIVGDARDVPVHPARVEHALKLNKVQTFLYGTRVGVSGVSAAFAQTRL